MRALVSVPAGVSTFEIYDFVIYLFISYMHLTKDEHSHKCFTITTLPGDDA